MKRLILPILGGVVAAAVLAAVFIRPKTAPPVRPPAPVSKPALVGPSKSGPPAEPKTRATDALALVHLYLSALKAGNFPAAYTYLSPDLQKALAYRDFVAGFHGAHLTAYHPSLIRVLGAGNFSLIVGVPYTLTGPKGSASYVATLRCVDITPGAGKPDWRVESISYQAAKTSP